MATSKRGSFQSPPRLFRILRGSRARALFRIAEEKAFQERLRKAELLRAQQEKEFQKRLAKAKTHLPLAAILKGRRAAPPKEAEPKK